MTTPSPAERVDTVVRKAAAAAPALAALRPAQRADALDAVADALQARSEELIPLAQKESHLPEGRLIGELLRTAFQLRLFGDVLREGAYLDARIDHPVKDWPMGAPRMDLRRVLEPIGPVAVFAASNFPFAFSVAGGDTASALAAGNPVIVKTHPGHPELSATVVAIVAEALAGTGLPDGVFGAVDGVEEGTELVQHPLIRAAGFTGSIPGGRALFDLAAARPEPIPFYGELGSNNPAFVTAAAASARGQEIADGFIGSFTLGAGQFCTKPGILAVPAGSGIVEYLASAELPGAQEMLNGRIQEGYVRALDALAGHDAVEVLRSDESQTAQAPTPTLLRTTARAVLADPATLESECFGPTALVVEYEGEAELAALARSFTGQLTATLFAEESEQDGTVVRDLVGVLAQRAGRVLWGGWPTGVLVTHAQQHGGPYPATTAPGTTSVGTAAIGRFLRPVAYQTFPDAALPEALQEANPLGIPRLVDGVREAGRTALQYH
jgi:NADP-dependent aldehyde dehydrogenase